ncbi:hypothetical protein ACFW2V_12905 [Streptomyces sp. NPDC058947]|uniref:hypothetical protein n=1 Tax=Streptomyces sp. NPDC058947 TaxID=3346675 RepID=UPI0036972D29
MTKGNYVKAIAVDFDGVIHRFDKGWQNGVIYGDVMPGAMEGLRTLLETYAVFIHTTRDPRTVVDWLEDRLGFPVRADEDPDRKFWDDRSCILVTNKKLVAIAYLDDRAIVFRDWDQAMTEVDKLW